MTRGRTLTDNRYKQVLPEQMLLARARAGEGEAFDQLFVQNKDGVYACLWHMLEGDADLVEEAVGSVFLNAYRSLRRFRSESSFSTWLYRIAVNEAHARLRVKRGRRLFGWISLHEHSVADETEEGSDPSGQVVRAEQERSLWRAVRALPEPYRTPIILRYMSGLASPEIADALKRPAGTVRYQLSRGLQILRERLGSEWTT